MTIEFRNKPETVSATLLILGFILFLFDLGPLAYAAIFLGIISSIYTIYTIFKNPISGVYMTIFFLPLTKTADLPYFGSKISLADVLFAITFFAYFLKEDLLSKQNLTRFRKDYYLIPLGLFLFFSLLSAVNAISIKDWAVEVTSYLFLAFFFLFFIHALDDRKKIDNAIKTLMLSLSIVIVLGFLGYVFFSLFNLSNPLLSDVFKLTSTFKKPNQFSLSVFVGFYLLINEAQRRMEKKDALGVLILSLISAIGLFDFSATGSRVALLIPLPILLFYVIFQYFSSKPHKVPVVGVFLIFVGIGLVYLPISFSNTWAMERSTEAFHELPQVYSEGVANIQKGENGILAFFKKLNEPRYHQLKAFFGMVNDYPLLGVGAGNFKGQMLNYVDYTKSWQLHNTFLGILAETGPLGFISFALFLGFIFIIGIKKSLSMKSEKYRAYLLMIMLGLVSTLMFQMVHFGLRNRHMWLGFALLVGINKYINK